MSHITEEQIEWIYTRYDGDMINCANAVARQAVVSYIDQQARELPVLPDPRIAEEEWFPRLRAGTDFYTVDQLKAHYEQGKRTGVSIHDETCYGCSEYYANKWESA